ncbi:PH domain-containing protein [Lysobacter arvi]|uniref:PH domain-containing protein n=1 Tax=Lysobacter arvi TaxID=3038776 RepID=A0ABU1CH40_9GAMM|nr:PH domain-containing protein [Lysobacter arvi]MDR0184280.1 PH domain-containing protein [Lysobacter arvi]
MADHDEAAAAAAPADWQPLPDRARLPCMLTPMLPLALPGLVGGFVLAGVSGFWFAPPVLALAGLAIGAWVGLKHHRHTYWRLDADGLAVRRGRLWQRETRVPASRVQHLDLKRGPLQRHRGLATLVVHTAGTRHSAVTVPHLDAGDAERLRDLLARPVEADDADDDA